MSPLPGSVLGVDLSLTRTGLASASGLADPERALTLRTAAVVCTLRGYRRRRYIVRKVLLAAETHDLVGLEGPAYGMNTPGNHERAGLWWMVRDGLHERGIPTAIISPSTRAKYATGKGGGPQARKPLVHAATRGLWPQLKIKTPDEADALLLAAIAARVAGRPFDTQPPSERFSPVNGIQIETET